MAFATNNNLNDLAPDVYEHGVDDWTDELAFAEEDVVNHIRVKYWNDTRSPGVFDKSLLTEAQWTKTTVYRALSAYILPKLATFREGDVFLEQIKFYKEKFNEELDLQFSIGIQYDTDGDGNVTDGETVQYKQDRLYR